jgi:hypothetical protein
VDKEFPELLPMEPKEQNLTVLVKELVVQQIKKMKKNFQLI